MNSLIGLQVREGAAIAAMVVALLGCTKTPDTDGGHTVTYYRSHPEDRARTLRACADDPGRLQSARICINASAAEREQGIGSLRDLPPMGLPQNAQRKSADPLDAKGKEVPR